MTTGPWPPNDHVFGTTTQSTCRIRQKVNPRSRGRGYTSRWFECRSSTTEVMTCSSMQPLCFSTPRRVTTALVPSTPTTSSGPPPSSTPPRRRRARSSSSAPLVPPSGRPASRSSLTWCVSSSRTRTLLCRLPCTWTTAPTRPASSASRPASPLSCMTAPTRPTSRPTSTARPRSSSSPTPRASPSRPRLAASAAPRTA